MKMLPFEEVSFKKKEVHGQTLGLANPTRLTIFGYSELSRVFALPAVRAGRLGVASVEGVAVDRDATRASIRRPSPEGVNKCRATVGRGGVKSGE